MANHGNRETPRRLLDAAERLFAERGISHTSLRDITAEAGANVAAVNYYFGSKNELAREVFARRMGPLNEERIRHLSEVERAAGEEGPALEDVLRAFVLPTFRFRKEHPESFRLFQRFHAEPPEFRERCLRPELFREVIERYRAALVRALPGVSLASIWWGVHFLIGAMIHVVAAQRELEKMSNGLAVSGDETEMVERLVRFAAAGMRGMEPGR